MLENPQYMERTIPDKKKALDKSKARGKYKCAKDPKDHVQV